MATPVPVDDLPNTVPVNDLPGSGQPAPAPSPLDRYAGRSGWDINQDDVDHTLKAAKDMLGGLIKGAGNGIMALPGLAADATTYVGNKLTGNDMPAPTAVLKAKLDDAIPTDNSYLAELLGGLVAGAKVPLPIPAGAAPEGALAQSVQQARAGGYVVPPASVNPSTVNRLAESLLGKKELAADATRLNTAQLSQNLVKEWNLPKGTEITESTLDAVRSEAGKAYGAISSLSPQFEAAITKIKELRNLGNRLNKQNAANYNVQTEDQANQVMNQAKGIEDKVAEALAKGGKKEMYDDFVQARKTIAQTYDVEKGLNEARATVNAKPLAAAFDNSKPLTGALQDAGRSATAFPSAFNTQGGQIMNNLERTVLGSGAGVALWQHDPKYAMYALAAALGRKGGRAALLSGPVQDSMLLSPEQKASALTEALTRTYAAGQN